MADRRISELPFGDLTPDSIIPIITNNITSQTTFGVLLSKIPTSSGNGIDTFTTGGTYNEITGVATFTNNTGGTYSVTGFNTYTGSSSIDTFTTGGTYNEITGVATFTNNTGGTYSVTGFSESLWSGGTGLNSLTTKNTNNETNGINSVSIGNFNVANAENSFVEGYGNITGYRAFSGILSGNVVTISDGVDYTSNFTSGSVLLNGVITPYLSVEYIDPDFNIILDIPIPEYSITIDSLAYSPIDKTGFGSVDIGGQQIDDQNYFVELPTLFDVNFLGDVYSSINVSSNNFLTFGGGDSACCLNLPADIPSSIGFGGIFLSTYLDDSSDNDGSICGLYTGFTDSGNTLVVRYEGTYLNDYYINCTTGGTPNLVYNYLFYKDNPSVIDIIIEENPHMGIFNPNSGVSNGIDDTYMATFNGASNTAYRITSVLPVIIPIASTVIDVNDSQNPLATNIMGANSHAGGYRTIALGETSFVYGNESQANGTNTIVLGANITGNTANTTYVDRLNIKTITGGTSTNFLGIDVNGIIVSGSTLPINVVNTSSLFSTGLYQTGYQATGVTYSNFFGAQAGYQATGSGGSNFLGAYAGYQASDAGTSNFIGYEAGQYASSAYISNFIGYRAGRGAGSSMVLNSIGMFAGENATNATYSNFLGYSAGVEATNIYGSNFIGNHAGYRAINASNSNFIGGGAGFLAKGATYSNFMGAAAGYNATGGTYSNLFGYRAGYAGDVYEFGYIGSIGSNNIIIGTNISLPLGATNSINLGGVLFGTNTYSATTGYPSITGQTQGRIGINVVNPTNTLHIYSETNDTSGLRLERLTSSATTSVGQPIGVDASGNVVTISATTGTNGSTPITIVNTSSLFSTGLSGTGYLATGATDSNFFGTLAGSGATIASYSNFFGWNAGYGAKFSSYSNFFGYQAGYLASSAGQSNFLGWNAGYGATSAGQSNFLGYNAGYGATNAYRANFIGYETGQYASAAYEANFIGMWAGRYATNATGSFFVGYQAGQSATNAASSNFIGYNAGQNASAANGSNFIGGSAGLNATSANLSNFIGAGTGEGAKNADKSNFLGYNCGYNATGASRSNFIGSSAGTLGRNATNSNFIGNSAGYNATDASYSNFFGTSAGSGAFYANQSNFIGFGAGYQATNANNSNLLGYYAGYLATGASFSNLFGYNVGYASNTSRSIGSNNIIIGTNISLQSGTTNSINLGGVLFGSGTYAITAGTPSISAQTQGKIGINVVNPLEALHVSGNTLIKGDLTANTISATTYYNLPTSGPLEYSAPLYQAGTADPQAQYAPIDNLIVGQSWTGDNFRDVEFIRTTVGIYYVRVYWKNVTTDGNKLSIMFGDGSVRIEGGKTAGTDINGYTYVKWVFKTYTPAGVLSDDILTGNNGGFFSIKLYN